MMAQAWLAYPDFDEAEALPLPSSTERLIIRMYRPSDAEAFCAIYGQPDFTGKPLNPRHARQEFNHQLSLQTGVYDLGVGIFLKGENGSEGKLIGCGGVGDGFDSRFPAIYYVFDRAYWGRGFATEFVTAFLQVWWSIPRLPLLLLHTADTLLHIEGTPKVEMLCARVHSGNVASLRVLEKTGFEILDQSDEDGVRLARITQPASSLHLVEDEEWESYNYD